MTSAVDLAFLAALEAEAACRVLCMTPSDA
jgi:hypothetical protein